MSEPWSSETTTATNEEVPGKVDHCPVASRLDDNDDMIARKVRSTVKEFAADEIATMVEEIMDDVLRKALHKAHSGVGSVVYNVLEQVKCDRFRKDFIRETKKAHIAKNFDTDAVTAGFSKRC